MKFGVCRGLDDFEAMKFASQIGIDYWECGFGSLACFDDDKIALCNAKLSEYSIPLRVANGFLPGHLNVVGENIDYVALTEYLDKGFERAKAFGVEKVVFGSGKARSFDNGFSIDKAKEQLAFFLSEYASPRAKEADCSIVMEPLRFCESSMIHTVADGIRIAEKSGAENVFCLADLYHVFGNNDSIKNIPEYKGMLRHAHIAEPVKRTYPSLNDDEKSVEMYKDFLSAINQAGCETVSIEAHTDNFNEDFKNSAVLLKNLFKNI